MRAMLLILSMSLMVLMASLTLMMLMPATPAHAQTPPPISGTGDGMQPAAPLDINLNQLNAPKSDLSRQMIESIIGDRERVSSTTDMLGNAMRVYNAGALICVSVLFLFTTLLGVAKSAQDGRALGSWSHVMVPLRFVFAITLLFPVMSGFSIAQMGIIWLLYQGVGLANLTFNSAIDGFVYTTALKKYQISASANSVAPALKGILLNQACVEVINQKNKFSQSQNAKDTVTLDVNTHVDPETSVTTWEWGAKTYGEKGIPRGLSSNICGSIKLDGVDPKESEYALAYRANRTNGESIPSSFLSSLWHAFSVFFSNKAKENSNIWRTTQKLAHNAKMLSIVAAIEEAKKTVPQLAINLTQQAKDTGVPVAELSAARNALTWDRALLNIHNAYDQKAAEVLIPVLLGNDSYKELQGMLDNKLHEEAKSRGWIRAGIYPMRMALDQEKAYESSSVKLIITPPHVLKTKEDNVLGLTKPEYDRIDDAVNKAIRFNQNLVDAYPQEVKDVKGSLPASLGMALGEFLTYNPDSGDHPLSQIVLGGQIITTAAGAVWLADKVTNLDKKISGDGAASAITWGASQIVKFVPGTKIAEKTVEILLSFFSTMLFMAKISFFVGIVMCCLPLLPAGLWLGGVVGWLVAFIVGIMAVPLWNAAHAFPEGSDLSGRGGPGYMILIELMFRPVFMIFGLLLGMLSMAPLLILFNLLLFGISEFMKTSNPVVGIGLSIAFIVIYGVGCWIITFRCFHLISIVPQAIFNYIGGRGNDMDESTSYSRVAQTAAAAAGARISGGLKEWFNPSEKDNKKR